MSGFTQDFLPGCNRAILETLEDFKIPLPAHSCRAQKVLNDENRDFMISRNHKRAGNTGFGVNEMISTLPIEGEALLLKNCG
jgi:hypothetical protein